MKKKCLYCNKEFEKPYFYSIKEWEMNRKYCSRSCKSLSQIGGKHTEEHKEKIRKSILKAGNIPPIYYGKDHPRWKECKKVYPENYQAIHAWLRRNYGSADHCEFDKSHVGYFEWANISGNYLRNRSDFMSLCVKCHRRYDSMKYIGVVT